MIKTRVGLSALCLLFLIAFVSGCSGQNNAQEVAPTSKSNVTETPTKTPNLSPTPSPTEAIGVTPIPPGIPKATEIPKNTDYHWVNLNKLSTVTVNGEERKTGLLGKAYIPENMSINKTYPIHLKLSRDSEAVTMAIAGVNICPDVGIDYDIPKHRLKLYFHLGLGVTAFCHEWWDLCKWHWLIWGPGLNAKYEIDKRLYNLTLSDLEAGKWNTYKINISLRTNERTQEGGLLETSVMSSEALKNGYWVHWKDNFGVWVENERDNIFRVGAYQRELTHPVVCIGPGVIIGLTQAEIWAHFGLGFGGSEKDRDEVMKHLSLMRIPYGASQRPPERRWVRIDWLKVKASRDGYIKHIETHEIGNLDGKATSDEEKVKVGEAIVGSEDIYSIEVSGVFTSDYGEKTVEDIKVYYKGEKGIESGDKIKGFVNLVTKHGEEPSKFILAYYIIVGNGPFRILPIGIEKLQ